MAITDSSPRPRILVAGCGKLGGAIATRLLSRADVFGLRRNPGQVPDGVTGIGADLTRQDTLAGALPSHLDVVIYCLTPSRYDDAGYRAAYVDGLANLLSALKHSGNGPLHRLFFISSTSVYAQDDDSEVNEDSPTEPRRFSGRCVLEGERLALGSGHPATVVRFSGIYGPTRGRFLEEVMAGRLAPTAPAPYSNRIHEVDAARVVEHLATLALGGQTLAPVYVASDNEPVRLDVVVDWVRGEVPCAPPAEDAHTGGRAGSKRCSNQRLRDTGFVFNYPNFRAGYREMISALS
ncbi:NAD-dependent epimerase/dehydratase family protein [Marinobacter sp. C2H3]|uniref:NAD-dependent epimerase/dehydratase family protein n=1 Tax=Marinobacter sp. C2H3 TaxID=3119003 RepID=UPI00300EFED4